MLRILFRPKWRHPDPEVRRAAVATLDPETASASEALAELARSDPDPGVRMQAVTRLRDLDLLMALASDEPDGAVKQRALERFRHCLCSAAEPGFDVTTRIETLKRCADPEMWVYVAVHGEQAEIRLAALGRVEDEAVLAELAVADPVATVRRAALDRLTSPAALERVAKASRQRDKRISRLARERFQALQVAAGRQTKQEAVCADLEALLDVSDIRQIEAAIPTLEARSAALGLAASPAMAERFAKARESLREHADRLRPASPDETATAGQVPTEDLRSQRITLCENVEGLLRDLDLREAIDAETERQVVTALELTQQAWNEVPPLPDREERQFQAHFTQARDAVCARLDTLRHERTIRQGLSELLERAEALAAAAEPIAESAVQELARRQQNLGQVPAGAESLSQQLVQAQHDLRARLRRQKEARSQWLADLVDRTDRLEKALDAGELAAAHELAAPLEGALQAPHGGQDPRVRALADRLHKAMARKRELDGWRRWADTLERDRLCAEVEGLAGETAEPRDLAARIEQARAAWGTLGPLQSARDHALWRRFNHACEQAYAPCRAYFRAQAEERAANLSVRKEICSRLEQHLRSTDWDAAADWQATEHLVREARSQWKALGPVPREEARAVHQRFEAAMAALHERLRGERERSRRRKLELVLDAEALVEHAAARDTVQRIRTLRSRWQTSGYAAPGQERELRQQFEAACRAVSDQRRQHRESVRREIEANQERREALCERVEMLAALDGAELEAASQQAGHLDREWLALGPAPRETGPALERRFREGLARLQQRQRDSRARRHRAQVDLMSRKARSCTEIENLAGAANDWARQRMEAAREEWATLPALETETEGAMDVRFARACELALKPLSSPEALDRERQSNLQTKETLCIRMEILAGIDSPPETSEARLRYQVARLAETFGGSSGTDARDPLEESRELARSWYTLGPLPPGTVESLEARFQSALHALLGSLGALPGDH
jgi:exonuclease SbcC